jgi:GST-like protein
MGSTPYLGGGFGHFYAYAPEKFQYPIDRYAMETKRQLDVLDQKLNQSEFIACNKFTIADIATWPWYGQLVLGRLYSAGNFLDVTSYKNVVAWAEKIDQRPTTSRARMVNRIVGNPKFQLHERHETSDFELKTQDKLNVSE